MGGIESVNCHTRDALYRDTHIGVALNPNGGEDRYVIGEVKGAVARAADEGRTWRDLHKSLKGRCVRCTGSMFYDAEPRNAAVNSSGRSHIWRGPVWEIHPVTRIEVRPGAAGEDPTQLALTPRPCGAAGGQEALLQERLRLRRPPPHGCNAHRVYCRGSYGGCARACARGAVSGMVGLS